METYLRKLAQRSLRAFSVHVRTGISLAFILLATLFVASFVTAEKESVLYVFPTSVSGEGWEHEELALGQDLSLDAEYADFSDVNSAVLSLDVPLVATSTTFDEESPEPHTDAALEEPALLAPVSVTADSASVASDEEPLSSEPTDADVSSAPSLDVLPMLIQPTSEGSLDTEPSVEAMLPSFLARAHMLLRGHEVRAQETPEISNDASDSSASEGGSEADLSLSSIATTSTDRGTTTEAIEAPASSTIPEVLPMAVSNDPKTVLSCVTEGVECRMLSFVGFGLGGALAERPFRSATLELSLAGRTPFVSGIEDRFIVRAFQGGRWEYLGEMSARGEFSNAKRGGYLSFALPSVLDWSDLSDLKIVVEYVRDPAHQDQPTTVLLDGLWLNIKYASEMSAMDAPGELSLMSGNVRSSLAQADADLRRARRDVLVTPDGIAHSFVNGDDHDDATIAIKTDREVYHTLGRTSTYFNITNTGSSPEAVRLQFHFPVSADGTVNGEVIKLSRFARNVPYRVGVPEKDAIGYFCATGWGRTEEGDLASTTLPYRCEETGELVQCDALNAEGTNCIREGAEIGLSEDIEYRDGWVAQTLATGSYHDDEGILRRALDFLLSKLPEDAIPSSGQPTAYLADRLYLEPGQTVYFRADLRTALNGHGDLYLEAAAESGAFGLVRATWDGSWNYRVPIDIMHDDSTPELFIAPISFADFPKEFWQKVDVNGADLRFVDERGQEELPYSLATWDKEQREAVAWVRVPRSGSASSTRIFAYYGNAHAQAVSDPFAPFRTEELTPRAVVFGKNQRDMTLHAIALTDDVRVSVGVHVPVLLKKGESALFDSVASGMEVRADGPVTLSLSSVGDEGVVVPAGFAGRAFIIPGMSGSAELSLATLFRQSARGVLRDGEETLSLDPLLGTILGQPLTLDSSLRFDAEQPVFATLAREDLPLSRPLYPATSRPLLGFVLGRTVAGFGEDGSALTALCGASGARQEVDGRRFGAATVLDRCAQGPLSLADVLLVSPARPSSVIAETEGMFTSFLPETELASHYILPRDTNEIAVFCSAGRAPFDIGVFDPHGTLLASTTCVGFGERPGKELLRSSGVFPSGGEVRTLATTSPFGVVVTRTGMQGTARDGVELLYGAPLFRSLSPQEPKLVLGAEEFVIPGEHRLLDVDDEGRARKNTGRLISSGREFSAVEEPTFQFRHVAQSTSITRTLRDAFGIKQFTVNRVAVRHVALGAMPFEYEVVYGENSEWSLSLKNTGKELRPGKYILRVEIEEGGDTFVDEYDFYWGVLALNAEQSVYVPGEVAKFAMGALSDNGDTLCDARLKLWVTPPASSAIEVPVSSSGKCDGNNIVDVPDYTASFAIPDSATATGTYALRLVRFDENDNALAQVNEYMEVRDSVPFSIKRDGPTRIYPLAHYPMAITVTANEDFEGSITERLPGDFVVIDRGAADLKWGDEAHSFMTATWQLNLKKGNAITLRYVFDAPDISPYLFRVGPLRAEGNIAFVEAREWQIASDAVGKMLIFWDGTGADPSGWTCVSCSAGQPFYQRYPFGSSSYSGVGGGYATHTHAFTSTLFTTGSSAVGQSTAGTGVANISHTHSLTINLAVASNTPPTRTLRILEANSAGEPATLPSGAIIPFDLASSSLPSGWMRYSAQDGYFPMGENSVGTVSGKATTSHAVSATIGTQTGTNIRTQTGGTQNAVALSTHTHTLAATTTSTEEGQPPYVEILFAKLTGSATATPNYAITMWNDTPPEGWTMLSGSGGPLESRFLKASTTYGATGGSTSHTHLNLSGMQTGNPSTTGTTRRTAPLGAASNVHTHQVDVTDFVTASNMPQYMEVVFAKRLTGIVFFDQNSYRIYANQNANTPTDPWPEGGSDLPENVSIDASTVPAKPGDVLRLRMSLGISNATATPLSSQFKLQYVESTACSEALNWSDVGGVGASSVWRGYDNSGVTDGATLSTTTLSIADVVSVYTEASPSAGNPLEIGLGKNGEWDWVIEHNNATSSTNYCFRMVRSDGTPLETYTEYPQIYTNSSPGRTVASTPFDNEKASSTAPSFEFYAVDPENDDLDYQIQIATNEYFSSPVEDKDSGISPELFSNIPNPTNKAPFNSGDPIRFTPSTALSNGTTYWWRVRSKDPGGSDVWGAWSTARSVTIDTAVVVSTWFQTTRAQFVTDVLIGATTTGSNDVQLITGSTTGTLYSTPIDFDLARVGTAWGRFAWNSTQTNGTITYQVEYQDPLTEAWSLLPDAVLPGNAAGFGGATASTSLLSVDASTYERLRLRANLTNVTGTPYHLDWTLEWGYKVTTPEIDAPFDNAKVATRTPTFAFTSSDPQGESIVYQISWSTTPTFTSSTTRSSDIHGGFVDVTPPSTGSPFTSGDTINFTVQSGDILTNGVTYYYRIRARDPSGANDWSFWTPVRSFTVDTAITVATWFQTDNGQFDTDIFTSVRTIGTGAVTVATATDAAMFAYGEGVTQTPRYRLWSGTAWGSEQSALSIGATVRWAILRASPLFGEYMLGTMGSDRDVNIQVYRDGQWANKYTITGTSPNLSRRSFDVAYETLSGRAMVVACTGTSDPTYAIWSATSSSWVATGTVNLASANDCEWIRMASHPSKNEIIVLSRDTGPNYEAQVWNGSSWGNSTGNLGAMSEVGNEGMALAYESSGNQALIAVSDGTASRFRWRAWTSDTSSWSAATTQILGDDFENGNMATDPTADRLALCYIDEDNDIGVVRWTGAAWVTNVELTAVGISKSERPMDCMFETTPGRTGYIQTVYGDTTGSRYRIWNGAAWAAQASLPNLATALTYTSQLERTSFSGTILGAFFVPAVSSYYESRWSGSAWSSATALETNASVASAPYGQPFALAAQKPAKQGTLISTPILFADGNAPAWERVLWSSTTPSGATLSVQVQYLDSTTDAWSLIPDTDLSGNSVGFTSMSIGLSALDTSVYHTLRLVANLSCYLTSCPSLNDWTVEWAEGLDISGTAKQHDLTTNVTSGTVGVAVNGVLQAGKTGTISGGAWTIPSVTMFPGDTVRVFVSGGPTTTRAVAIATYAGPGDLGGLSLNERWITIGSASGTTPSAVSLADLAKYDYSVSGNNDLFFDVDGSGDLQHCAISGCSDAGIYVLSGNTFRPATTSSKFVNTFDLRIAGALYADANTIKVGGSWRNLGGFTAGTGTVIFNATTSTRTIDSTGAATSTFANVTFGEAATGATWTLVTPFVASGNVAMNYGTTSPGAQAMTLQGNLLIGPSGTFLKGTATTTFSGSGSHTWTDNTAAKQDLGNISVNGSGKTLTLSSSVRTTHLHIATGNTLNGGGAYTMNIHGFWDNQGTFTAQSGNVAFATTTPNIRINQGTSPFYDLTFSGVGGSWSWLNTNATATNNVSISSGTVTLPGGIFAVGGSFTNSGGTFAHNSGLVRMFATQPGKTITASTSSFFALAFDGSGGGWSFVDQNATTTDSMTITAGTVTFPAGTLAVGRDMVNSGGVISANGGTLAMTSTLSGRSITTGGSSLAGLLVRNAGIFTITDTNAVMTGNVTFLAGTTTLPSGNFAVGGSFAGPGIFVANGGTVTFSTASGARTVDPASSSFANVTVAGTGGTLVFSGNATTTGNFALSSSAGFTLSSGRTLAVGGTFTNSVGGATTTWSGSTLALNSGTEYSLNTKTQGGDDYGTLRLAANTKIRSWNSQATTYLLGASASLYSQDHAAIDGDLHIFGEYVRSSGSDHWSYATDFDGTALLGASRQVDVRFEAGAAASFGVGTTLEIVGTSTATTTIDRRATGNFGITLTDATLAASSFSARNMNTNGLRLLGATTIATFADGDFTLDVNGGSTITVSADTIDANPALQIFRMRFASSTGIAGFNVTEVGDPFSYWRFKDHYGVLAGENFDNDPAGNPGYVRWDDSDFAITITGTVYADAGVTPMGAPVCDNVTPVVRVKVDGLGNYTSPCSSVNGNYAIVGVPFSGDTVMTIYLDTNGGPQAALVTRSAAGDLFSMNLYRDRVIVRHEDVFPMTIAKMAAYDSTDDADVPFTATTGSPDTLTLNPEKEFWIWSNMTFVPGGNITLLSGGSGATHDGTFHIDNDARFTAQGSEVHSVGGRFAADNGAIFTAASSTFNFTATTSGKLIVGIAPLTFWNMNFTGTGGVWSIDQALTVQGVMTPSAGTITGASSITAYGTSLAGAGTFAMTGGTFTLANGGTFGGGSDWSFANLTFGNGTIATTTKTGSSTVSVSGVLSVATAQTFRAGTSTTWILSGGGTPFALSGAFVPEDALFRYAASGASANVTPATYHALEFAATGASTPTYTILAGTLATEAGVTIGNATGSAITLNANTNDPSIVVSGDVLIRNGATLTASDSGTFAVRGDWTNDGTFISSNGTVTFDAPDTGHSIDPGSSSFAHVRFDNALGGWSIVENATATASFTIADAGSFTLAPGKTLEVGGAFTNLVGGTATDWSSTTLHINSGTTQTINTKALGADTYATLRLGANTQVRMWDSSVATTTNAAGGSLYSQDHEGVSGSLYIYGNYSRSSGADHWSFATDFDGATGTARQVNVRIASSSTLTFSGGALNVVGTASASTTIDTEGGVGGYSFGVSGGALQMRYYSLRHADQNGLNISGNTTVTDLSDGDLELSVSGGTMMRVEGATIDANPLLTFQRNRFATSSGVTSGYNVTAVGTSVSAWRFNLAYGNRAGEAFDNDPGGDPGYIIWDDSAAQLTISGNVYSDEGVTPIGAPTCDGVTQNVRLRVQGGGSYTSACNETTGAYSISGVIFNPKDTLTVYLDTNGGARAVNIAYDPATNIGNMHLYQNRVILRHEQGNPVTIGSMAVYDRDDDTDIPFNATTGVATSTGVSAGTGLIVWSSKVFAPGGNVTVHANASSSAWDGSVRLMSTSTWSAGSGETHTIGGNFVAQSAASVAPGSSLFSFTASTTGKVVSASSSLSFYDLTFGGVGGAWNISGIGTTTNNLSITSGTTTLPSGILAVGGNFENTGGAFVHNGGTLKLTATTGGKTIRAGGSDWNELVFAGSGGAWTFADVNATTTGTLTIISGTPTFPSGTLAVGGNFENESGSFLSGNGTLALIATTTNRSVRLSGSSLGNLLVSGSGTFLFLDQRATTTGNVAFVNGTTTFPFIEFTIGGSFLNTANFVAGTSTVRFVATTTGKTINPGASSFYAVAVDGSAGGYTFTEHATTTNAFTLRAANAFTLASGKTLSVGGAFSNLVGGAATTWTGSILALDSGTSFTVNTKTQGSDVYATLRLGSGTQARMWDSSASTVETAAGAGLYSQDHTGVSGSLAIFGDYRRTSGTDHWSYAKDFDGTLLGGSSRQVNVRFAPYATATYATAASLEVLGVASASTTIDRLTSGNYAVVLDSAFLNASHYQFRNTGLSGLSLLGTTTITSMNDGDFSLDVSGGSMITIASTTIDQNASAQFFDIRFATSSGVTSGYNVSRVGTTGNAITFNDEYGNYAGESYDDDGADECGSIRWSDSACLISDQRAFRFRADDGAEGAPAGEWFDQSWSKRKPVRITNNTNTTVSDRAVKMTVSYDADMRTDFGDLRFTDASGTSSVPYWFESVSASSQAVVWVAVPELPATGYADLFMYFGSSTALSASSGTSTFLAFDDFEDGFLDYTGNTSLFAQSAAIYKTNSYGLAASSGNENAQNTDGIRKSNVTVGRDTTWHFWQRIDMSTGGSDEPCFTFAVQSPVTLHQNYGVCLSPSGLDKVIIAKNVAYNSRNGGATELATTTVTFTTGWYEVFVDHLSASNRINVSVYTSGGSLFATTSATDSSYTSGSFGFSYWYQHGGWDTVHATPYISSAPSVSFGVKQSDSGASWLSSENSYLVNYPQDQNVRVRFSVRNSSLATLNEELRLQVAAKLSSPNCESVPNGNFVDVPTATSGCGSSPACMTSSTQFANKASTTQLLSLPKGYAFTPGQIVEDPSNETDTIVLPAARVTEAEYNFRMTANAALDRYCLRVVNATTPLDNYSRVAEIQVLHPPMISDVTFNGNQHIALVEGTTTVITATATVTDLNGFTDLVAASSTFYRSSVSGGTACAPNGNDCYQIASSSCSFSDCTGNSCTLSCSAPMYYFADPTDIGTFASDVWNAFLDVWDLSGAHSTDSSNQELYTLSGLTVPASIDYGNIVVGDDTGGMNPVTPVSNTGNSTLNLNLGGDYLRAGANTISYSQQKYATSTFNYSGCAICNSLAASSSPDYYPLGVAKSTTSAWFPFKEVYWGIGIPPGTAATTFFGFNDFGAVP